MHSDRFMKHATGTDPPDKFMISRIHGDVHLHHLHAGCQATVPHDTSIPLKRTRWLPIYINIGCAQIHCNHLLAICEMVYRMLHKCCDVTIVKSLSMSGANCVRCVRACLPIAIAAFVAIYNITMPKDRFSDMQTMQMQQTNS